MSIPTIVSAEYVSDYVIRIGFDDGAMGDVDLEQELWGDVFSPLKDIELFKQFELNQDLHTVVWPTGADFAPEFFYERVCANRR